MCVSGWLSSRFEAGGRFSDVCHAVLLYAATRLFGHAAACLCLVYAYLHSLAKFEPSRDVVNIFMIKRGVCSLGLKDFCLEFAMSFHLIFPSSSMDVDYCHTGLSVRCGS